MKKKYSNIFLNRVAEKIPPIGIVYSPDTKGKYAQAVGRAVAKVKKLAIDIGDSFNVTRDTDEFNG